jgi:hypothetical protein
VPWAAAGVPIEEIRKARDSITSMWGPGHGSWPEVWASLAARRGHELLPGPPPYRSPDHPRRCPLRQQQARRSHPGARRMVRPDARLRCGPAAGLAVMVTAGRVVGAGVSAVGRRIPSINLAESAHRRMHPAAMAGSRAGVKLARTHLFCSS